MRQFDELTESHACGVGLQVLDLSQYSSGDSAGSVAGSLAVVEITSTQRCLLVGLRNGRVITYRIAPFPPSPNTPAEVLIESTVRRPSESPVTFVASRAPMGPAILALLQERTLFARPSSGSPVWRRLCLEGEGEGGGRAGGVASHAAPFCCEACPFGYARVRVRLRGTHAHSRARACDSRSTCSLPSSPFFCAHTRTCSVTSTLSLSYTEVLTYANSENLSCLQLGSCGRVPAQDSLDRLLAKRRYRHYGAPSFRPRCTFSAPVGCGGQSRWGCFSARLQAAKCVG